MKKCGAMQCDDLKYLNLFFEDENIQDQGMLKGSIIKERFKIIIKRL